MSTVFNRDFRAALTRAILDGNSIASGLIDTAQQVQKGNVAEVAAATVSSNLQNLLRFGSLFAEFGGPTTQIFKQLDLSALRADPFGGKATMPLGDVARSMTATPASTAS